MTPNDIEVLLHCHTRPMIHPRANAPAVIIALGLLEAEGLIEKYAGENYYITTELGKAHVSQICNLDWPTKKTVFVGACGKIIEDY